MECPLPLWCGGVGLASASVGEAVVVVVVVVANCVAGCLGINCVFLSFFPSNSFFWMMLHVDDALFCLQADMFFGG